MTDASVGVDDPDSCFDMCGDDTGDDAKGCWDPPRARLPPAAAHVALSSSPKLQNSHKQRPMETPLTHV